MFLKKSQVLPSQTGPRALNIEWHGTLSSYSPSTEHAKMFSRAGMKRYQCQRAVTKSDTERKCNFEISFPEIAEAHLNKAFFSSACSQHQPLK